MDDLCVFERAIRIDRDYKNLTNRWANQRPSNTSAPRGHDPEKKGALAYLSYNRLYGQIGQQQAGYTTR